MQSFYGDSVESMSVEELKDARVRLCLDAPIYIQYIKWIGNALHGDFGLSLKCKMPAMKVVSPLIGNTLLLGGIAYIIMFTMAVFLAMACAANEDSLFDRMVCKIGTPYIMCLRFGLGLCLF